MTSFYWKLEKRKELNYFQIESSSLLYTSLISNKNYNFQ